MTMSTFPVNWDDPADACYTWTLERMHAPEPMTLADALAFTCAFDHGVTAAARTYGVPLEGAARAWAAAVLDLPAMRAWSEAARRETWVVEADEAG